MAAAAETGEPVVATLLPITTWFLMKDHHAPARAFIDAGVPVAIGTDFNPGTSPAASLPLAMSFACVNLRMSPDEALAAVTINAARALALEDEIGSLEPGKVADLVIWRVPTSAQIPYWPGADLVRTVIKRGRVMLDRPYAGPGGSAAVSESAALWKCSGIRPDLRPAPWQGRRRGGRPLSIRRRADRSRHHR